MRRMRSCPASPSRSPARRRWARARRSPTADGTYRFTAVTPGDYAVRVRAGRFLDRPQRGHPRQPRVHRHGQRRVEGRVAAGIGDGDRPVAGRRHVGHADWQHLRRQAAVGAADLARLLLAARRLAGGADDAHRRRRQHQRHAAGLHRLRHDRPGPRHLRGHQRDRERPARSATIPTSAAWRKCRSTPPRTRPKRRRPACSRSSSASRAATSSAARSSAATRRRAGRRSTSTPIRSRAACRGGGGLDPEDVNRLIGYQDMNAGLRRLRDQGPALVVRLVPAPGHQGALRQLPGQAADRRSSTTTAARSPTTCRPTTS